MTAIPSEKRIKATFMRPKSVLGVVSSTVTDRI